MSVSINYTSKLTATETIETGAAGLSDKSVIHSSYDTTETRSGSSTPPATKVASFAQALTTGAATLDLTALPSFAGSVVDGTGLRVQYLKARNKSTNANNVTISINASNNGFDGFGDNFSVGLVPGAEVLIKTLDGGTDIGASNKTIDLSGTGSQVVEAVFVLG